MPPIELVVTEDVAESALGVFLEASPRTLLLSGGSTPRAFYERVSEADYPWDGVEAFFGDERCVPSDSELSNFRMASDALLSRVGAQAFPIDGAACDANGYERILRERFGERLRFDLALYGLGTDGHTASLFPGRPEVEVRDRWVVGVAEAGAEPLVPRISLTVPALSSASLGVFLVQGEDKRDALGRLLEGDDVPAARIRPGRLIVLADREAAGEE